MIVPGEYLRLSALEYRHCVRTDHPDMRGGYGLHRPSPHLGTRGHTPAGVIIHPQVNNTIRRGEASASRCLMSSWLAPAPSTRTSSLARNRAGIWAIAAASTST
jgi:hypothetical protein